MVILELKGIIIENSLERIEGTFKLAERRISKLEDRLIEIMQSEEQTEKRMKGNEHLRDVWNIIRHTSIHLMELPEEKEVEKGVEKIFEETILKNFPNLLKSNLYIEDVQQTPSMINTKRSTNRQITVKMLKYKDKEEILKAARKKRLITYKETPVKKNS